MSRRRPRTKQVEVDRGKAALRFHKLDKLEQDGGLADAALPVKDDSLLIRIVLLNIFLTPLMLPDKPIRLLCLLYTNID